MTEDQIITDLKAMIAALDFASLILMFFPGASLGLTLVKDSLIVVSAILASVEKLKAAGVPKDKAILAVMNHVSDTANPWIATAIKQAFAKE